MERQPRPVYGFLPADLLTLAYLAINLVLVGIGYRNIENAEWLLVGFTGAVVAVIGLRYVPRDLWPLLRFIRESYPLLALPLIYSLVGVTNKAIFPGYFDDPVARNFIYASIAGWPFSRIACDNASPAAMPVAY